MRIERRYFSDRLSHTLLVPERSKKLQSPEERNGGAAENITATLELEGALPGMYVPPEAILCRGKIKNSSQFKIQFSGNQE